jgi:hypothetical protein
MRKVILAQIYLLPSDDEEMKVTHLTPYLREQGRNLPKTSIEIEFATKDVVICHWGSLWSRRARSRRKSHKNKGGCG